MPPSSGAVQRQAAGEVRLGGVLQHGDVAGDAVAQPGALGEEAVELGGRGAGSGHEQPAHPLPAPEQALLPGPHGPAGSAHEHQQTDHVEQQHEPRVVGEAGAEALGEERRADADDEGEDEGLDQLDGVVDARQTAPPFVLAVAHHDDDRGDGDGGEREVVRREAALDDVVAIVAAPQPAPGEDAGRDGRGDVEEEEHAARLAPRVRAAIPTRVCPTLS